MSRRLVQLLPSHHRHDAVGNEALVIERELRDAGWQVDTFAEHIDPDLVSSTRSVDELTVDDPDNTLALYHFAVCSNVTEIFANLPCRKTLIYHNVTPPEFFQQYSKAIAGVCEKGLEEIRYIADKTDLAFGVSEFNRLNLEEFGFKRTRVLPILFDTERYNIKPDESILEQIGCKKIVLFVGRMVPNKAPDDMMRVAAEYFDAGHDDAVFVLVGKRNALPEYSQYLDKLYHKLGLDSHQFLILDEVTQKQLIALLKNAAVFLSLSRHEGFFVPLLESFLFRIPVMARATSAIPETAGEAAYLFDTGDYGDIATMLHRVLHDNRLREDLKNRGEQRLERFNLKHWAFVLNVQLNSILNESEGSSQ